MVILQLPGSCALPVRVSGKPGRIRARRRRAALWGCRRLPRETRPRPLPGGPPGGTSAARWPLWGIWSPRWGASGEPTPAGSRARPAPAAESARRLRPTRQARRSVMCCHYPHVSRGLAAGLVIAWTLIIHTERFLHPCKVQKAARSLGNLEKSGWHCL